MPETLDVIAGALFDRDGRVLITQRLPGSHMAGKWEFPGGKLNAGEGRFHGLRRELREELGVDINAAEPLVRYRHDYPERRVVLDIWHVLDFSGTPEGLEGQALAWVFPDRLWDHDLLEADAPIVEALLRLER